MSELVTGDAVVLDVRLARLPSRALAFLIDLVLLLALGVPMAVILGLALPGTDDALAAAITLTAVVSLLVGVPTAIETLSRGRSLGKLVMGLRVVGDDGGPIRLRHALVRALAGVFADFGLTFGAGALICSLVSRKGKRIGDLLAGTVVVRERVPSATWSAEPPPMPPPLAPWAATLELSRLPDQLALSARTFLARAGHFAPEVRDRMGADIASSVAQYVSPRAPTGTPAWAYLAAVLAERRRREGLRLASGRQVGPPASPAPAAPAEPGMPRRETHPAPPAGPFSPPS